MGARLQKCFPSGRQQLITGELQVEGVSIPPTEALGVQIGYCARGACDDRGDL